MRLLLNEAFTNPQKKNAEDLAKTVLDWYDFDTNYIDDGGQRRAAETKNKNTVNWFNEHPIEIKKKAFNLMLSKVHSSDKGKLQREFEKHISENSNVNEGKDDFVARYGNANIILKKGYKHHNSDDLEKLYDKIGSLVKGMKVKDVNVIFESLNGGKDLGETVKKITEASGTLAIEKRKDGKYYWEFTFKSGKKEDWPHGFDNKADAQKDFVYRSKYIKEYVTESNSLNEVNVTRIPNLNLESDAYITMLDLLKNNAKFKSIVSIQAEDLYSGGRTTNVFNILRGQLSKIMTPQIILSVIQKINSKRMILSVDTDDVNKGIHNDRFAGILALGIVDSLIGDPLDLKLIKDLGNAKVAKLAQEYSINRGKQKFSSIIGNIKF